MKKSLKKSLENGLQVQPCFHRTSKDLFPNQQSSSVPFFDQSTRGE